MATLLPSQPGKIQDFPPESNRRCEESGFVRIDDRSLPHEVGFVRPHHSGALDYLPDNVERRNEQLHGVVGEEIRDIPGQVAGVSIVARDDEQPDC